VTFRNVLLRLFALLVSTALFLAIYNSFHKGFGWHDQQRLYQLFILTLSAALLFFHLSYTSPTHASSQQPFYPFQLHPTMFILVIVVLALGAISVFLSQYPSWALKEWARYIGLFLLALLVANTVNATKYKLIFIYALGFIAFLSAYQFVVYYLMVFLTGIYALDADLLFNGFSNPRFLNQFQILLMPILAFLTLQQWQDAGRYRHVLLVLFCATLSIHWCIALTLGGRGLWLGLAVGHAALLFFFPRYWRLLLVQVLAASIGFSLFYVMFTRVPSWLELEPTLRDSLRTGLSSRGIIWQQAWDLFLANPIFGVGPMHFAAYPNSVAAHPHQVVLQWLAEWGLAATLIATALATWGIWHGLKYVRSNNSQPLDAALWLSIIGALILAQVDGVFVMPYTETWLAIIVGVAMARWRDSSASVTHKTQIVAIRLLALPVIAVFGYVLLFEVPVLVENMGAYFEAHSTGYKPRFWIQGFIPM